MSPGRTGAAATGESGPGSGAISKPAARGASSPTDQRCLSGARAAAAIRLDAQSASTTASRAPQLIRICSSCAPREAVLIGVGDRAHPRAAEIGRQDRRTVAAHQRDPVAGFDASLREPRRHPSGDIQRLGEAPVRVAGSQHRPFRRARGASREHRRQRAFRRREALREGGKRRVGIVRKQGLP